MVTLSGSVGWVGSVGFSCVGVDSSGWVGVSLSSDAPWLQVYSADNIDRVGIAVEPMSCPPNAFNSGTDVVALGAGQTHTLSARIAGFED